MNEEATPTYQGISFQVPDHSEFQRIGRSLEKIGNKPRDIPEPETPFEYFSTGLKPYDDRLATITQQDYSRDLEELVERFPGIVGPVFDEYREVQERIEERKSNDGIDNYQNRHEIKWAEEEREHLEHVAYHLVRLDRYRNVERAIREVQEMPNVDEEIKEEQIENYLDRRLREFGDILDYYGVEAETLEEKYIALGLVDSELAMGNYSREDVQEKVNSDLRGEDPRYFKFDSSPQKIVSLVAAVLLSGTGPPVAASLAGAGGFATGNPGTITVDDEPGDADYSSIQDGIDAAEPGDIVEVYSGKYDENVEIYNPITLKGIPYELGKGNDTCRPIIDARHKDRAVTLLGTADGSTLRGFKIINGGSLDFADSGILLYAADSILRDNIIENSSYSGIDAVTGYCTGCNISENVFSNNDCAILLWGASDFIIHANEMINNDDFGVWMAESHDNVISDNLIKNSKNGVLVDGTNNILKENDIVDNDKGVHLYAPSNKINRNNFIGNGKDANFYYSITGAPPISNWDGNYWEDWHSGLPRPVYGLINFRDIPLLPWINYDLNPRQTPVE